MACSREPFSVLALQPSRLQVSRPADPRFCEVLDGGVDLDLGHRSTLVAHRGWSDATCWVEPMESSSTAATGWPTPGVPSGTCGPMHPAPPLTRMRMSPPVYPHLPSARGGG